MIAAVSSEWLKVRGRRLTWILLGLTPVVFSALYALLFLGVATASQSPADAAEWDARLSLRNLVPFADAMVYRLVALFCIILAGSVTANEFGWRTILTAATWCNDRRKLAVAKLAVVGAAAAAFVTVAWMTVLAAVVIGNTVRGTLDSASGPTLAAEIAQGVLVTWAAAMVWVVISTALALWTRSAAAAIALPLGVLLLEPLGAAALTALGGVPAIAADFTLSHNVDGLLAWNGAVHGVNEDLGAYPSAWRATLFLALFGSITAWLATRTLQRRDIVE